MHQIIPFIHHLKQSLLFSIVALSTINVLKKDPGVSKAPLKNKEKAAIVDALKDRYTLPMILRKLEMPKSSYYYQKARSDRIDKYQELRKSINAAYYDNRACYGYRRIHAVLKKNGFVDCQVKLTHFYV